MPTVGQGFTLRDANRFVRDVQRLVAAARAANVRLEAWAGSDEGPGYDEDAQAVTRLRKALEPFQGW